MTDGHSTMKYHIVAETSPNDGCVPPVVLAAKPARADGPRRLLQGEGISTPDGPKARTTGRRRPTRPARHDAARVAARGPSRHARARTGRQSSLGRDRTVGAIAVAAERARRATGLARHGGRTTAGARVLQRRLLRGHPFGAGGGASARAAVAAVADRRLARGERVAETGRGGGGPAGARTGEGCDDRAAD